MPNSHDRRDPVHDQLRQLKDSVSTELRSGQGIWFKVISMLQQNWAVCEPTATVCRVRFFDDDSSVFDRLEFPDTSAAAIALAHNGFTRIRDRPSFMTVAPLPRFPLTDAGSNSRPVYSSGDHWKTPPEGCEFRQPRRSGFFRRDLPLNRFIDAQDPVWFNVLEELVAERKRTHWMWFVFPQHRALGQSDDSFYYGLASLDEVEHYWRQRVLGPRLKLTCTLLLAIEGKSAVDVLGPVDAMKLRSCATLFGLAVPGERVFTALISKYYEGQLCQRTIEALEQGATDAQE